MTKIGLIKAWTILTFFELAQAQIQGGIGGYHISNTWPLSTVKKKKKNWPVRLCGCKIQNNSYNVCAQYFNRGHVECVEIIQ